MKFLYRAFTGICPRLTVGEILLIGFARVVFIGLIAVFLALALAVLK